ncbi:MAG: hypothetical protein KME21_22105 [Desmonostoc vinosum HA7617-LM4]|jgi:hypothetical protein|nr:hypothetical protein [Desmonostoc vinosum HA7617-LM4]
MQRVIAWLKNIRPVKVLTVFLAGIFLFLTQACNRPNIAAQPPQPGAQVPNAERYDPTKSYPLSSPERGMNNFSDVDPRSRTAEKAAQDKAEALVRNAQKNINQKGVNNPADYVENFRQGTPLGERVKRLGENVGGSADEVREGVVRGTQRGIENIKENTQDLTKNVQRGTEDVKRNAQRTVDDAGAKVNRTIRDAA